MPTQAQTGPYDWRGFYWGVMSVTAMQMKTFLFTILAR